MIGVRLEDGQEIRAETTVIAAGGWSGELGAELGSRVRLQPTRRHLMVTAPDRRVDPAWPVVWCLGEEFYCRPESGGLLLCACDQEVVDPNTCHPTGEMCQVVAEKAARLLPSHADAGAAHFWCGIRTLTEDGRFVIGFDPELRNLFWVAGLGGHGMVCSFEVGRLAADLLSGCDKDREVARALSPARFAAAGMIRSRSATGRA